MPNMIEAAHNRPCGWQDWVLASVHPPPCRLHCKAVSPRTVGGGISVRFGPIIGAIYNGEAGQPLYRKGECDPRAVSDAIRAREYLTRGGRAADGTAATTVPSTDTATPPYPDRLPPSLRSPTVARAGTCSLQAGPFMWSHEERPPACTPCAAPLRALRRLQRERCRQPDVFTNERRGPRPGPAQAHGPDRPAPSSLRSPHMLRPPAAQACYDDKTRAPCRRVSLQHPTPRIHGAYT